MSSENNYEIFSDEIIGVDRDKTIAMYRRTAHHEHPKELKEKWYAEESVCRL